ncbi:MAG: DUF4116 domain-containing protein, partial [Sphingobacteriaceae bacterium]
MLATAGEFIYLLIHLTDDSNMITDIRIKIYPPLAHSKLPVSLSMVQMYVLSVQLDRIITNVEQLIHSLGLYISPSNAIERSMGIRETVRSFTDSAAFILLEIWCTDLEQGVRYLLSHLKTFEQPRYRKLVSKLLVQTNVKEVILFVDHEHGDYHLMKYPTDPRIDVERERVFFVVFRNSKSLANDKGVVLAVMEAYREARFLSYWWHMGLYADPDVMKVAWELGFSVSRWLALTIGLTLGSAVSRQLDLLLRIPDFANDREMVLHAIDLSRGWACVFASASLRADREIVTAALTRSGNVLEYCPAFQDDRDIVLLAIRNSDGEAVEFASARLRAERE